MALASGATDSSRSRMMPSAGRLRAFSSARAFDPGMNSRLRRGRIMGSFPSIFELHATDPVRLRRIGSIGSLLFEHDLFGKPVPTFPDHALTFQRGVRKAWSCWRHMVSNSHAIVPATTASRLPDLC